MAVDDKYVMNGVWLTCDKGVAPSRFNVTPKPVQLYDEHFANELDKIPMVNILPFGVCSVTKAPCVPAPVLWERVMEDGLTVLGARPLLDTSKCQCGVGGKIAIHFTKADATAAVELDKQLDKADELAEAAEKAAGWAFFGGLALAVGGAILCATGVGAPLGAAMIAGGGHLITASTILASAAAVTKGVTSFIRDPSLQNGLSIVGQVATDLVVNYVMNKLGGAVVKRLGQWAQGAMNRLNLSERACRLANRTLCTVTGHPVDVISGYLYTEATDFEFPGAIPLRWERLWNSTSVYEGPLGHGWHHSYDMALFVDAEQQVVAFRAADGRGIAFSLVPLGQRDYNRLEKLSLVHDEQGYAVLDHAQRLTYRFGANRGDGVSMLTRIEDANGFAIVFTYDARGFLTDITDSGHRQLRVSCDEHGRIRAIATTHPTEPKKVVTLVQYAYNRRGELISATDALGQQALYHYNRGLLVQETFKNGLRFYFHYDGTGPEARCVRTWGDEGIYDHKLVYDVENRRTTVTNSLGYSTTYIGNENGLVVQQVDQRGGLHQTEYNEYNEVLSETDPLGYTTTHAYDERGNCLVTAKPNGAELRTRFDAHDQRVELTDAAGGRWQWTYDEAGNITEYADPVGGFTKYEYRAGRLRSSNNGDQPAAELQYDAAGNLRELHTGNGQRSQWLHDAWGRVYKYTDPRGNVQWTEYDLLSRPVKVYEPDGNVRQFAYDGFNNVTRAQDRTTDIQYAYRGMSRLIRRVEGGVAVEFLHDTEEQLRAVLNEHGLAYRYELDAAGDVSKETGFDGRARQYQRDAGGRIVELLLPTNERIGYQYNSDGQVTEVQYSDGSRETYAFREDGALLEATNGTTSVRFKRDVLGRALQQEQGNHTLTSVYGAGRRRVELHSSLGAAIQYQHTDRGEVEKIKAGSWQVLFERDAQGLEVQRSFSGGRSRWKRDQLGRPIEQRISSGARQAERIRTYSWQPGTKLTQLKDSTHGNTHFEHDAVGKLAAVTFGDGSRQLRLSDAAGNLFKRPDRHDRRYGPAGQLLEANGTHYRYDAVGNLVSKRTAQGEEWSYKWNAAGQLTEVVRPDGRVVRLAYDALGRRVSKALDDQITYWVWDHNVPLHEWTERQGAPTEEVVTWLFNDGDFAPVGRLQGSVGASIVVDHLGTPLQMHGAQGQEVWAAELDAYGKTRRAEPQQAACPFRYKGQYDDPEIGLYYNRFRYYDPEAGQYISQDPIDLAGGLALYSYVADPTVATDAWGLLGEGDVARYGSSAHKGDGREAHELLRNKFLQDNNLTGANRHRGNPSIALSPANHDIAHAEEFRLRRGMGLGNNDMLRTGKHEIRIASQAINNTLVQTGDVSIQQLRTARRYAEKFAKKMGCY